MKTLTFIPEGKYYRVKELNQLVSLPKYSGKVATIDNLSAGIGHSAHAYIDATGSIEGMKALGYWHKSDVILKQNGFFYNISIIVCSDLLDELCLAIEKHQYVVEKQSNPDQYIFNF